MKDLFQCLTTLMLITHIKELALLICKQNNSTELFFVLFFNKIQYGQVLSFSWVL